MHHLLGGLLLGADLGGGLRLDQDLRRAGGSVRAPLGCHSPGRQAGTDGGLSLPQPLPSHGHAGPDGLGAGHGVRLC